MRLKPVLVVVAVAAFGWVGYKAFFAGSGVKKERGAAVVMVQPAALSTIEDLIEALGTAKANESVVITSHVTESIKDINFDDGEMVDEGRILVELSKFEETAELQNARSNLAEQEKQYQRAVELVKSGAATKSRLDTQTAALKSAKAQVAVAEARINDRVIKAPFTGILGLRQVSPGSLIQPGTVITTLDDIRTIKLDFAVPETYLAEVQTGLSIQARNAAYPDRVFEGKVSSVDTRVDPATRTVTVRAQLDNPEFIIRPGMLMVVDVVRNPRERIMIPEQAIMSLQDRQYVYVMDAASRAQRVTIKTGIRRNGMIEVTEGLNAGDNVVVEGAFKLRPGAEAKTVPFVADGGGA
ncbi:MAG: efflux RND transporter periplasmic adaptor subunit [Proteobacteria bacterium]|nr:efflux RND transporter periplasmic adaptor subunit [Pseudomonadota bacterium]